MSKQKAAKMYNVPRTTLTRRLVLDDPNSPATRPTALTAAEEDLLVTHILQMEERGFGLTINDICRLAYNLAEKSGRPVPFNSEKKSAGYDWWRGFLERHPCADVAQSANICNGFSLLRG